MNKHRVLLAQIARIPVAIFLLPVACVAWVIYPKFEFKEYIMDIFDPDEWV